MNVIKYSMAIAWLSVGLSAMPSACMEIQEQTASKKVVFVDFDDVLTKTFKVEIKTIIKLLPCILRHPLAITYAIKDLSILIHKGHEIACTQNMPIKQVIIAILHHLKDNNYGDFFEYQDVLYDIGMHPGPINTVIEQIKQLKQQGHILIGATNQDYASNSIYSKKLQEQGINLNELFSAILTTYAPETDVENDLKKNNVFMADKGIKKPNKQYFEKLKEIAIKQTALPISSYYLIDNTDENIIGAEKAGFIGIQFELPLHPKTGKRLRARDTCNQGLRHAAEQLKQKLIQEGLL